MNSRSNALIPGTSIEHYAIERVLGIGGFGITYSAIDRQLGHRVAIKEYFPAAWAVRDPHSQQVSPRSAIEIQHYQLGLQRFLEEARTLACFKNIHVVRVSRFLQSNGTAYILMDYEEGLSLYRFLSQCHTLSATELQQIAIPLLIGIAEVHQKDFLHRDIKPANVYLRKNGAPVLIDFGSARRTAIDKTTPVTSLVTPGYSPFEQYNHHDKQGPWTDIYGLGATLYHCISGDRPADALDRMAASQANDSDPLIPAAQIGRGHYPDSMLEAIDAMLCIEPDRRPTNIDVLIENFSTEGFEAPRETPSILENEEIEWDPVLVHNIQTHLAEYLGPMARILTEQALQQSHSVNELCEILASNIDDVEARIDFLKAVNRHTAVAGISTGTHSTTSRTGNPTTLRESLHPDFILNAGSTLASYVGPIATTLVENAIDRADTQDHLLELMADEIPSDDERTRFIQSIEQQLAGSRH